MKRLILSFVVLIFALLTFAEEKNAMLLHLASGKQVICLLDENPIVTFYGDELKLITHMSEITYQSADVLRFTYIYVNTASINHIGVPQCIFSFKGNTLSVIGADPNSKVTIFTVDGVLVASTKADKNGAALISLLEQSGKVYVVKTSVANFKITKP